MHASVINDKIVLRTHYSERERVRRIPGVRWNPLGKAWVLPATPAFAARVLAICGPDDDVDCTELLDALRRRVPRPPLSDGAAAALRTKPWGHQRGAIAYCLSTDAALLHMHMGTGKTKVALDTIHLQGHKRSLVLCPKSVIRVWGKEFGKHGWHDAQVVELHKGSTAKRAQLMAERLKRSPKEQSIFALNYEAAWRGELAKAILGTEWDCLIMDESSKIKAPGGKASRFCARIKAGQKLALTGTPMPHSPLDIYAQYRALDPGIFGLSFTKFRGDYAIVGGYQNHQVLAFRNEADLRARMDTIRYEVKADALDLPPLTTVDVPVTLERKASRVYQQMEQHFIVEVKSGVVTAANALVKLLRLQQITSGYLPAEDDVEHLGDEKAEVLAELLEEAGHEPVVVFCRFKEDLKRIRKVAEELGRRPGEISGSCNDIEAWDDCEVNTLAVQLQAGGMGIDLSRAHYGIYYSLGFSLGMYDQTIARLHRPGQRNPVTVYRLLADGSVDEKIAAALDKKRDVIEAILREVISNDK